MIPFHKNPFGFPRVSSMLRQVLEGVQDLLILLTPEGRILQTSPRVQNFLKVQPSQGALVSELPCWSAENQQQLALLLNPPPNVPLQWTLDHPTGRLLAFLTPLHNTTGKITHVLMELQPHAQAEYQVLEVLQHSHSALALLHEGQLIWSNLALGQLLGMPCQEISGTGLLRLLDLQEQNPPERIRWTRPDGETLWLQATLQHHTLEGSDAIYTLLEFADATPEWKARQDLEALHKQLEFALQSSGVGSWEWAVQHNTLLWDARMCEMYGLEARTFEGPFEEWPKLVHPEDSGKVVGFTYQTLNGINSTAEFRILLPDGLIRHTRVVGHPICDENGKPQKIMGTSWDITPEKRIELELREAHRIAQIGSWKWDLVHRTLECSEDFRRMLGYPLDAPLPTLDGLRDMFMPQSLQNLQAAMDEAIVQQDDFALDVELKVKGQTRWIHLKGRTAQNRERQVVLLYGTAQDITESRQAREALQALSNRLLLATEAGGIGIWEWDSDTMCIEMDRKMLELLNIPEQGNHRQDIYQLIRTQILTDDQPMLEEFFRAVAEGRQQWQHILHADFRVSLKRGKFRVIRSHARVLPGTSPGTFRMLGTAWDITDQKTTEHLIRHQANHDALTDLPNRRLFFELLSQEIKNTHRTDHFCAVLFIDLDRFKEVNDTFGHQAGDELLKEVANRLKMCTRASDVLARLSGDEFVIMLTHLSEISPAAMIAERILAILSHPIKLGRDNITITASIGIAVYPEDAEDANKLLVYADQAMYNAKNEGKNRYAFFQKAMQDQALQKRTLTLELSQAIRRNALEMYYQPILDLNTHSILKAEALLRWKHPEKGFISPAVFIPIAEESDLIHALGDWVFKTVVQQIRSWNQQGLPEVDVSVNVSAKQFLQKGTMERFMGYTREAGIHPDRLIIEITESVFLQDAFEIAEQFRLLQEAGIRLALDDFGTGYSSLNYLTRFDTRFIKIDRSFVKNLTEESSSPIIDAIIAMSHQLGKTVIAEGVETRQQVEWLKARSCDYVQGYYYAKPMPAAEFVKFVLEFMAPLDPDMH